MPETSYLKAAALSPRVTVAHPDQCLHASLEAVQAALQAGAQVIALPELGLCGCTCGDIVTHAALLDACGAALLQLAAQTRRSAALIAVGLPVRALGRLYNCAAILQSGNILGLVPKRHLSPEERRWFTPHAGDVREIPFAGARVPLGRQLFSTGDCTLSVEFDGDTPTPGAEVVLRLSAEPEQAGLHERRRSMLAAQSASLRCGVVYAGAGAGESTTDFVFSGPCLIAENGEILTENRRYESEGGAVYACLDLELLRAERRKTSFADATESLPVTPCAPLPTLKEGHITRKYSPSPFVPLSPRPRDERCREILTMQAAALAKRLTHVGQRQMLLGLSGGLDSTLALLVAARTADLLQLPRGAILCITMPGYGTTDYTRETAGQLAAAFGATLWEIDIRPACDLHMQDIGHDPNAHDATYENVQARERAQVLMDLANQEGALLLGTGDLSELALGWCTYNADHMSMYNPNAGVPKTLVRHLVRFVLDESAPEAAAALERVLKTPVSPELLPTEGQDKIVQRTEDILGSYDVHDFYLYYFYHYGFRPRKLYFMAQRAFAGVYAPEQLKAWLVIFLKRFFSQQFKRSCLPDGPGVVGVSLSPRGAWRMPSDASAALWLQQAEEL